MNTRLAIADDYVAIDTETTGLDTEFCDLIEVAAIRYKNGAETERFSSLVKPEELPISEFIEDLTGITSEELEDAPTPSSVIPRLCEFIGDDVIVGHNVCFDGAFLARYYDELGLGTFDNTLIDTLRIARHTLRDLKRKRLDRVIERCERESGKTFVTEGTAHRAPVDAAAAAFCYETMKPLLVNLYGDDPDEGFRKKRNNRARIDFGELLPTVDEIDDSNPFFGSSVCFTGKLSTMTRDEAAQRAVNLGALPQRGVTKKLDYLVVGSFEFSANLRGDKSGKLKKAESYIVAGSDLQIISEGFFMRYAAGVPGESR